MSLSKNINPSLVLVQPRKMRPFITERLLIGRKELNQTNKYKPPDKSVYWKTILFISHPKTYLVGSQKNPLNEMVLLSTQNTIVFKLIGKNIIAILH